ncbi:MAG TPA: aconitase X catalytic domain-containing protein [Candidatus Limnocylindrales bacterium]|nr:aconitase X catalytic domain-containing protein [Candidatus Limnocylindrales bacterium]
MARAEKGPDLRLTADEDRMLSGAAGEALQMAMHLIVALARVNGARRLRPVSAAHIDGCLYHGPVGLDFAERLVAAGGRVAVPTTLNVSALDLLHPELIQLDAATRDRARQLMDAYVAMGCDPTWTCAPYQLPDRPRLGQHVAWAESNAIVFANSVLGARTGRYGDFIDICAALTGRVPDAGLHRTENRRARIVLRLDDGLAGSELADELYGVVGHVVGQESGGLVPAIVGLPGDTSEDQLKALSAAAASAGAVAMFHAVGVTPEAETLEQALGGRPPKREMTISRERLARAWGELSTTDGAGRLAAVSVGTPHLSMAELSRLDSLLDGKRVHQRIEMYASTGRRTLETPNGQALQDRLGRAGVKLVVDTCTYVTPVMRAPQGSTVMTDSAKWAWYAPGNLGVEVVYGSVTDCVRSAVAGRIIRERPAVLDG